MGFCEPLPPIPQEVPDLRQAGFLPAHQPLPKALRLRLQEPTEQVPQERLLRHPPHERRPVPLVGAPLRPLAHQRPVQAPPQPERPLVARVRPHVRLLQEHPLDRPLRPQLEQLLHQLQTPPATA